jgi:hypothetical protein
MRRVNLPRDGDCVVRARCFDQCTLTRPESDNDKSTAPSRTYSRLMGDDEAATVRTLTEYRQVFTEHSARHGGRIVDTAGDSVLAVFDSAVEAVECGADIQKALHRRNRQLALADVRLEEVENHPNYDVDPSGTRFVMPEQASTVGLGAIFDVVTAERGAPPKVRQATAA